MDIKKIIELVKKEGGATLDANTLEKADLKNGYMVSIKNHELKIKEDIEGLEKEIEKAIERQKNFISTCKNKELFYIGFWIDGGYFYIDISRNINRYNRAVKYGIKNEQISIYNVKEDSYIYLKKDVYILYKYDWRHDDFYNVWEFDNAADIRQYLQLKKDFNIWSYTLDSIEEKSLKNMVLLQDQYVIIKDSKSFYE